MKETIRAIHHYIVNTLTHTDFIDSSYFKKNDPDRCARHDRVQQKFTLRNNQTVAWKYGVCQNYSEIFQALCLQAGIPCEIVSSYEMDHTWNRVMLWGQWYHLDATFDDPGPSPTRIQTYFLQTPEQMMRSHLWDGTDYSFPDHYDPAWTQIDPKNITSADQFRKCFIGQLTQGKTTISLTVSGPDAYGGYRGPSYWAMQHCALPGWGLSIGYKYSAATKTYTFDVRYT